jgi:hypothetical protein
LVGAGTVAAFGACSGGLIDKGHARIVMTAGSLWVGLCLCLHLHSYISTALQFYVLWCGIGAGMATVLYTPLFAVATRRFPGGFRRTIMTITFLGGLASTVFIPLSAWVSSRLGTATHLLCAGWFPNACMLSNSLVFAERRTEAWVFGIPAFIGIVQVLGRAIVFWMDGKFNDHQVNRWIVLLMPIALGILLIPITSPLLALIFACVFGIANGAVTIVKGTAIARYVNRENVAALNGVLGLPIALGRAAARLFLWSKLTVEAKRGSQINCKGKWPMTGGPLSPAVPVQRLYASYTLIE